MLLPWQVRMVVYEKVLEFREIRSSNSFFGCPTVHHKVFSSSCTPHTAIVKHKSVSQSFIIYFFSSGSHSLPATFLFVATVVVVSSIKRSGCEITCNVNAKH